jgi:hypothetical protein
MRVTFDVDVTSIVTRITPRSGPGRESLAYEGPDDPDLPARALMGS